VSAKHPAMVRVRATARPVVRSGVTVRIPTR
jgi:hypothetical protein